MNILVTGAAGFIGSHLCERLIGLGHDVLGLDCFTDHYDRALKEQNARVIEAAGARMLKLDLAQDDLGEAVGTAEVIFHLAAQPGISPTTAFETYLRNNITATYRLLEAARQSAAVRFFIHISTSSVYGADATDSEEAAAKPISYYGVTKLAAEQLVMSYDRQNRLPACSLRLFSVYGPRERPEKLYPKLIQSILEHRDFPLYQGSETHSRSFTYIDDALDGLVAALGRRDRCRGEIINIGSDQEITTAGGIEIIEQIMGQKARVRAAAKMPGDQVRTRANIKKARTLLDYQPRILPEDGLRAEVEWFTHGAAFGRNQSKIQRRFRG